MGDYTSSGGDFEALIEDEAKRPHQWVNKLQKGCKLPKEKSPIFDELLEGRSPNIQYTINGTLYNLGYYLADDIYSEWSVFVKSIPRANMLSEKRKRFAQFQEGARKDIERAFGVLQKRFTIVCNPAHLWKKSEVGNVMKACIILHNMIIEDERDDNYEMNPPRDIQYSITV
ncbi:uncharacterized protein LOC110696222 [Chenopodium quinoa]|uniref:uncharacterized protein LOC110696222 n=1 Tax=Chenopodium quinoa TaxID=63459 RepID=UPI000B793C61|nr:uncharacterized protein LOC110696222 [Chenopodium quinoa]